MWHNTGNFAGPLPFGNPVQPFEHPEHPETKRRLRNLLEVSGLLKQLVSIEPRPATEEEILRVHTPAYLAKLRTFNEQIAADAGMFTPMGRGSLDIALLAAGAVIEAVDAVLDGRVDNAYALVRPPGHHALPDLGMGFCIFANPAIAVRHLIETRGLERVAIFDWDVHHGNGAEAIFREDPRVLTISVHQDNCFPPDSGHLSENGAGAGEGFNINIPLPPGAGTGAYAAVRDRVVIPALHAFRPQMIIVPSGFDAGAHDPLGRQMMTSEGYRELARALKQAAAELCDGRLVMCHEGGYNAPTVPFYGLAVMEELSGIRTGVEDPFQPLLAGLGYHELQAHQDAVIKAAEKLVRKLEGKVRRG
jgi:acetoin utilization deacetylase AcuC-like enzyme